MARPLAKIFDDLSQARAALEALEEQGFGPEVGLAVRDQAIARRLIGEWLTEASTVEIPEVGKVLVTGPLATNLTGCDSTAERLAELIGIPPVSFTAYYQSGLRRGGALILVQAEGERTRKARALLAAAEAIQASFRDPRANSPAFVNADRATETNPLDLRMSGDFRKY
jgi:hypothetical protein